MTSLMCPLPGKRWGDSWVLYRTEFYPTQAIYCFTISFRKKEKRYFKPATQVFATFSLWQHKMGTSGIEFNLQFVLIKMQEDRFRIDIAKELFPVKVGGPGSLPVAKPGWDSGTCP